MSFTIRSLAPEHIDPTVKVHMNAFPSFFLTFLGPRFLKEFYRSFLEDAAGIGLVAVAQDTGQVIGVVVGPFNPQGYFKRLLKRRWWAFCLASTGAILRRPTVIKRLLNAVLYRGDSPDVGPPRALLSSLAVHVDYQKHGIGRALVNAYVDVVKQRGGQGCFLTTDADGNEKVNRFYQSLGWVLESTFVTPQGRRMNRYTCDIQT